MHVHLNPLSFLHAIGHHTAHLAPAVSAPLPDAVIAHQILEQGVSLVEQATVMTLENDAKREWVVRQLAGLHVPQGVARIIVEIALSILKQRRPAVGPT